MFGTLPTKHQCYSSRHFRRHDLTVPVTSRGGGSALQDVARLVQMNLATVNEY